MATVISRDGTEIAFERSGSGPALILVDGALCHRGFGPSRGMASQLSSHFTVYIYDRRGRGESGDTGPYAIGREVEDLEALIKEAGGSAFVCGFSSGAVLALEAAVALPSVTRVALYEAPFVVDDTGTPIPEDFVERLRDHVASGHRGAAVDAFMKLVGTPPVFRVVMRATPVWPKLKAVAHTLPYDITVVSVHESGKPIAAGRWASLTAPALVMDGGKSPQWMRTTTRELAAAVPGARHRTLAGQTHMVKPGAIVPELTAFFAE
ncbi:MAG TPA: alpha/beta hydrolase [Actinocrinis sp.]|nr:alpha/beta hydrolase [Actinocrinis sp.]